MLFAGLLPTYNKLGTSGLTACAEDCPAHSVRAIGGRTAPADKACLWVAELLTWTLVGGVFALAAAGIAARRSACARLVVGLAAGLSLAIEVIQVVIPGRDVDLTSVLLAIFGSALGATLVTRIVVADARRWTTPALLIWGVAVTLAAWNPPRFAWPDRLALQPAMFVPFWSYFGSRTLEDLTDVVGQASCLCRWVRFWRPGHGASQF